MPTQNLLKLYERELNSLIKELSLFTNETQIWKVLPGVSNSAGNLTLHLIGNLNHFIGATLGNTGYVRNREEEFSLKNIPLSTLISDLESTINTIKNTLATISEETWNSDFPLKLNEQTLQTGYFMHHLLVHLSYHLGQINYLRRMLQAS